MSRVSSVAVRQRWVERLARFRRADVTVSDFCRRECVSEPSFYQWRRRLESGSPTPRTSLASAPTFYPVVLGGIVPAPVEIALPGGAVVRLSCVDPRILRVAIRAAARLQSANSAEADPC